MKLLPLIKELKDLNEESIEIARNLIGETLFKTDLYFCALLNKSIQLTDGFLTIMELRNLTNAGIILRENIDNCLRMFAMYIVDNPEALVDCIANGDRIDKLKDKDGKLLKDAYLKEKLGTYDKTIKNVYNNASGYVHFSEKGFYQSVSAVGDNTIEILVSHEIPEKANEFIIECMEAYIHYLRLFHSLFKDIIQAKVEYDTTHQEDLDE